MNRKHLLALAFAAAVIGGPAQAAVEDRFYATGLVQYVLFDDARALQNDFGWQLGFGMPLTDSITVEVNYLSRSPDFRAGGSLDQSGYGVDGLFFIDHDGAMDPYLVLGLGRHSDDYGVVTDDYSSLSVGVGLMDAINDNFAFRGEIRVYRGEDVSTSTDVALGLGVVYYFGEPTRQMAPVMADRDSDGDGVLDKRDRCPGTALGSKVDASGCVVAAAMVDGDADGDGVKDSADRCPDTMAGARVDANGCELDSDNDGVKDSGDQCPNTPAGVAVMANGCAPDSDGDGVKDPMDKCPGTPAGTKVLADGCPVPVTIKLEGVTFETNSDRITAGSKAKLDEAVATLKANPTVAVEVAGHTDDVGNADVNRALSQRRADAVRKYLVDGGVAADQVTARGYGEDDPVAGNDTAAGRAANRRVELRVKQ